MPFWELFFREFVPPFFSWAVLTRLSSISQPHVLQLDEGISELVANCAAGQHFIEAVCVVCVRVFSNEATVYESTGFGIKQTWVRIPALSLVPLDPQKDYFISLSLSFLIGKMGIMITPNSNRCCKN